MDTPPDEKTRPARRITIFRVFLLVTAVLFLLCYAVCRRDLPYGSDALPFDAAQWRAADSNDLVKDDITIRQKMLGDLVRRVLPGKSRGEIESLLGPSLDTKYFQTRGRDLIYVTGPERGFMSIDSEWLLIWLDRSGKFERFQIAVD